MPVIMEDLLVSELHTRLDHDADHVFKRVRNPLEGELLPVGVQRFFHGGRLGDGNAVLRLLRSTGDRHFGTDDEGRAALAQMLLQPLLICLFTGFVKDGPSAGNGLIRQRLIAGIVRNTHAGVQMDLFKAGGDKQLYQLHRFCHGGFFRLVLPGERAEMVTAEDDAVTVKAEAVSNAEYEIPEVRRLHAGVTAELVDLIGCGFDQHAVIKTHGLLEASLDHKTVCRAEGRDARILHPRLSVFQHSS